MRGLSGARIALTMLVAIGLLASGITVLQNDRGDASSASGFSTFSSDRELRAYINAHSGGSNSLAAYDLAETAQKGIAAHTETNTQEAGIDELDQIETDGAYIFISSSDRVDILEIQSNGGVRNVSTIKELLEAGRSSVYVQGIYLQGSMLVVVASVQQYYDMPSVLMVKDQYYWGSTEVVVLAYDVDEPSSPIKLGAWGVTGWYASSRIIEGHLYMVTQQSTWGMDGPVIPMVNINGATENVPTTSIRYDPMSSEAQSYTNVMSMELSSLECVTSSVLMGYGSVIYASGDAIYIACQEWDTVSFGDVASTGMVWTDIYRLDLNGTSASLSAKGRVEGYLNNQFSMDEKDGLLRVTTCARSTMSESMVFVMDRDLQVMGELRGLGPNETIQAARFIGDTLYLVTFLRTDPLFVIDLSDPADPKLSGELVIPGFSAYLHDVGDDRLIGVGLEDGKLKLSLFNVSDPADPREESKVVAPDWTWSIALWDHHAFVYDAVSGVVAVPVQVYGAYGEYNAGAYLFHLHEGGLGFLGLVQNRNESSQSRCLVIGGMLYTITDMSVSVWSLADLSEVQYLVYTSPTHAWRGASEGEASAAGAV